LNIPTAFLAAPLFCFSPVWGEKQRHKDISNTSKDAQWKKLLYNALRVDVALAVCQFTQKSCSNVNTGANSASKARGTISVIFGSQVSLRVHYCKCVFLCQIVIIFKKTLPLVVHVKKQLILIIIIKTSQGWRSWIWSQFAFLGNRFRVSDTFLVWAIVDTFCIPSQLRSVAAFIKVWIEKIAKIQRELTSYKFHLMFICETKQGFDNDPSSDTITFKCVSPILQILSRNVCKKWKSGLASKWKF